MNKHRIDFRGVCMAVVFTAAMSAAVVAQAQTPPPPATAGAPGGNQTGPARMAWFTYTDGGVLWRAGSSGEWAKATVNMPLREGAEISTPEGSRTEIRFDDGSSMRLGAGAVVTLQTMYTDSQGEYTEIKQTQGLSTLHLRVDHSVYQVDAPSGSVTATGPGEFRVGATNDLEIGVRSGQATVNGPNGKITIHSGDYADITPGSTDYHVTSMPPEDSWDQFNDQRDSLMAEKDSHLPATIQPVAPGLDHYGTWRHDSEYGDVWAPNETDPNWRPYSDGSWTWVEPVGWTWVGAEPWGWAPYHYGTWLHRGWGWGWAPGPAYQYWSPGVVDWSYYDGDVCWAPLWPGEVIYPGPFYCGFGYGPWFDWFSIGFFGGWGFDHGFWHGGRWDGHGGFGDHGHDHGGSPHNAFGGSRASLTAFRDGGHFGAVRGSEAFTHGSSLRGTAFSRPGASSWSSSHSLVGSGAVSHEAVNRSVYRTSMGDRIERAVGTANNVRTLSRGSEAGRTATGGANSRFGAYSRGGGSAADAARSARESLGWGSGRSSAGSGSTRGSEGGRSSFGSSSGLSGRDAANAARASLGWQRDGSGTYHAPAGSGSGYGARSSGGSSYGGRSYGGSSYGGRSYGGSSGYSGGRSYGGSSYGGSRGYGGSSSGGSRSYGGSSSSGSRSSGGGSSHGGGGGGGSHGGGGGHR